MVVVSLLRKGFLKCRAATIVRRMIASAVVTLGRSVVRQRADSTMLFATEHAAGWQMAESVTMPVPLAAITLWQAGAGVKRSYIYSNVHELLQGNMVSKDPTFLSLTRKEFTGNLPLIGSKETEVVVKMFSSFP